MSNSLDHKSLAIETYNMSKALLRKELTEAESRDLITFAATSKYHWRQVGGIREFAISDWLMSRAFGAIGESQLAIKFANSAIELEDESFPFWLQASLREGLARALRGAGRHDESEKQIAVALDCLKNEPDKGDVQFIRKQLMEVAF
jgi:hypothetical protein